MQWLREAATKGIKFMIGLLRGAVAAVAQDHAIIDVNGVGYVVHCSSSTLDALSAEDGAVSLWIDTVVREDMIRLNGFREMTERDLFRILQTVQGVGAKVALGILSIMSPAEAAIAITGGNDKAISKANGVGPKLAQRICAELKGKIPSELLVAGEGGASVVTSESQEAVEALSNLGYPAQKAAEAVSKAVQESPDGVSTQILIKLALKKLAS